jgi:cytochrome c
MLHQADLPKNLWAEAVRYAVWLKNHTSTKAIGNVTPYERLYGEKPNLGGCHRSAGTPLGTHANGEDSGLEESRKAIRT